MCDSGRVRVVNRRDPSHRIQFPGRANAERWLENHNPDLWDIVPITDDEADSVPGGYGGG